MSLPPNHSLGYDDLGSHETEFDSAECSGPYGDPRGQVDEGIDTPNSPMRSIVDLFKKRAAENGAKVCALEMLSTLEMSFGFTDFS